VVLDVVGATVVLGFFLVLLVAAAKPFIHAIRIGAGEPLTPPARPLRLEPPVDGDDDCGGVREPRRPAPRGSAGAVALNVDEPAESIGVVASEARSRTSESGPDARAA
jgi:hypothetical protein